MKHLHISRHWAVGQRIGFSVTFPHQPPLGMSDLGQSRLQLKQTMPRWRNVAFEIVSTLHEKTRDTENWKRISSHQLFNRYIHQVPRKIHQPIPPSNSHHSSSPSYCFAFLGLEPLFLGFRGRVRRFRHGHGTVFSAWRHPNIHYWLRIVLETRFFWGKATDFYQIILIDS